MKIQFNKRFLVRGIALTVLLLFGILMYFVGRQHTILLDNKTITLEGQELKALPIVEVQVDRQEVLELAARDRDKVLATNQKHSITISYTDSAWNEISFTRKFKVPVGEDMVMVSIPALVANPESDQSLWLAHYEVPKMAVAATPEESVVVPDELSLLAPL
ncbi:DUF6672 family protein [uncultured Sphaerochaeta sp.]|uniref:DUF6672 family protein n=1 Tax=uncultured Sphaerochaeta sp. TaxID=886478 RepID=UPI002A0A5E50|nr:DUF6672 family protein [uncultured Sphaerochaeta sp.]